MNDLSSLSNEQLQTLYKGGTPGAATPGSLSSMSDDQLKSLHAQVIKPDVDTEAYIGDLAKKHDVSPDYVRGVIHSHAANEMLKGAPALGGLVDKAGAGISALVHPLTGAGTKDASIGARYTKNLALLEELNADIEKKHPIANAIAQAAGGLITTAPLAATGVGAKVLGLTGATLPRMAVNSALSGTAIGAADAVTRGEDPLKSAALGGAVGLVAPVVGRAISTLAKPVTTTIRGIMNPADEAARRVAVASERDVRAGRAGLSDAEFAAEQAKGTPVNLMDRGGETTRALARSAANTSPEGRAVLEGEIDRRFTTQGERLSDWLNSTFHYPNAAAQREAIEQSAKSSNNVAYTKAMQQGDRPLGGPVLERLSGSPAVVKAMQAAAKTAQDEAIVSGMGAFNPKVTFTSDGRVQFNKGPGGVPTYPNLEFWDLTRRQLSDAATEAKRAGRNTDARQYGLLADAMNAELDRHVPSYALARQNASYHFGAKDALEAGQKFVTSNIDNGLARLNIAKMSAMEKQLFQDGFVDSLVGKIRGVSDRHDVINRAFLTAPAAKERIEMVLGPARARELETMLRVENVMDKARGAIKGNSTTARQLTELGLAGGVTGIESGGTFTDPQAALHGALVYGALKGRNAINANVSKQVAQLLTSGNKADLQRGIRLASHTSVLLGLRNADAAMASLAARAAVPAVAARQ